VKREAEDLTAKLWSLVNKVCRSAGPPHLKTKREQLKVIKESIEQLSQKNIPVPDDLPKLKEALSEEIQNADRDQVILDFLREQLSQMLATINAHLDTKGSRTKPENT
jgi:predicted transcriptional regulator